MNFKSIVFVTTVFNGTSKNNKPFTLLKCLDSKTGDTFPIFVPDDAISKIADINTMQENELGLYYNGRSVQLVEVLVA